MTTKWVPTPEILEKIAELAEQRVNEVDIAAACGIKPSTWWAKKREFPEIKEAIENAKRSKMDFAKSKLWKIIEDETNKNHFQALCFYIKNYDDEIVNKAVPDAPQTPQLPTGFTWRIVNAEDVAKAKGDQE